MMLAVALSILLGVADDHTLGSRQSHRGEKVLSRISPLTGLTPPPAGGKTILLLRGHKMTRMMTDRAITYARSCAKADPPCAVWISLDETVATNASAEFKAYCKVAAQDVLGSHLHIHRFSSADVARVWPVLEEARKRHPLHKSQVSPHHWASSGYGYHAESITNWFLGLPLGTQSAVAWLWVMEVDVAFCGTDITEFFALHQSSQHDLLGGCQDQDPNWFHRAAMSSAYENYTAPFLPRKYGREMIQRYSAKMVAELLRAHRAGMHAWSEGAACTLAKIARFTWRKIVADTKGWIGLSVRGAPAFLVDERPEVFERHCRATKLSNVENGTCCNGALFHPAKQ